MAVDLDLSEAFDVDMLDVFSVIRRAETITQHGRSSLNQLRFNDVHGVVTAASPNDLERLEDYSYQKSGISVVTQFKLYGVAKKARQNYQPDVVYWDSGYYLVVLVENYSRYMTGWIQAVCVETDYIGAQPSEDGFLPNMNFQNPRNSGYVGCF